MAFSHTASATIDGRSISVTLEYDDPWAVTAHAREGGEQLAAVTWRIQGGPDPFVLTSERMLTAANAAACVAVCLSGAVGKSILECLIRNKDNPKGMEDCLKDKYPSAAADAIFCILACLAGGAAA